MAEPTRVTAGDTWTWTRPGGEHPASDGWVLTYFLKISTETPQQIAADPSGPDFLVLLPPATTAGYDPGLYHWTARVSKAGEVRTIACGTLTVAPDPASQKDGRTEAEIMVDLLQSALKAAGPDAVIVEYELDGFRVKKDRQAVERELARWRTRARLARGRSLFRTFPVRFCP